MKTVLHKEMARLGMFLTMLVCAAAMTACGDDDNGPAAPEGSADGSIEKVRIVYNADVSRNYLDFFDVEASYTDIVGQTVTETIDRESFEKVIEGKDLDAYPSACAFKVTAKPRTDQPAVDMDKRYAFDFVCDVEIYVYRKGVQEPERVDPDMARRGNASAVGSEMTEYIGKTYTLCNFVYSLPEK